MLLRKQKRRSGSIDLSGATADVPCRLQGRCTFGVVITLLRSVCQALALPGLSAPSRAVPRRAVPLLFTLSVKHSMRAVLLWTPIPDADRGAGILNQVNDGLGRNDKRIV